ncbi:MAG: GNAT family N-acetyltransferase [Acidobacteria bacterium]|nr:GNAT family N-acetyltransferase [Acidobacteriota bacterium]
MKTPVPPHLERFAHKVMGASEAVRKIAPGQRVFVGTACATPLTLVRALESLPAPIPDVELLHFLTTGAVAHDAEGRAHTRYRHRSFFAGSDIRAALRQGLAEYVPLSIARVPELIRLGRIPLDVALIQVSAPDPFGYVSLGVSVDVVAAAVARAKLVLAEVNPAMPWTMGDTAIHVDQIHALVPVDTPVQEFVHRPADREVVERIAAYIAGIIEDGSTLQIGIGRIPAQALKYLEDRKDLGIHSGVITDAVIPLLEKGIVNGRRKTLQRGKVVASYVLGTRKLFDLMDRNPLFSMQPIEVVCHPAALEAQPKLVAVTQAFAIDLTGQVCSDQFEGEFYSGLEVQPEFLQGASRSPGGKPIICLTSTTDDGESSRIRPQLLQGEGVSVARTNVHYVITEYGMAYLFGKSVRERSIALIQIAHPKFRPWLMEEAKALGYLPADQRLENLGAYPVEEERHVTLRNGKSVLIRPARPQDGDGIRALFHKLTPNDKYTRFFHRIHGLSSREVQRLCNLNYETEVAFVAVHGPREFSQIVGHACYFVNPSTNIAETGFMVAPEWQEQGLGSALQLRMAEHARARGLRGFEAEILPQNDKMVALARKASHQVSVHREEDSMRMVMLF